MRAVIRRTGLTLCALLVVSCGKVGQDEASSRGDKSRSKSAESTDSGVSPTDAENASSERSAGAGQSAGSGEAGAGEASTSGLEPAGASGAQAASGQDSAVDAAGEPSSDTTSSQLEPEPQTPEPQAGEPASGGAGTTDGVSNPPTTPQADSSVDGGQEMFVGFPASSEPPAGSDGQCAIPAEAQLEDTSHPDAIVGMGTPESCTGDAFIEAVAQGGVITFDCGPDPTTIILDRPAQVFNDSSEEIVIDGGGLVTLSGGGTTRILYMNTCDENLVWTSPECQNQNNPRLTVQNLTFVDANSKAETENDGGGAIWVQGGRFKVINSRFFNNVCADEGPDVGGAAIRVFSQYEGLPVYVVNSTFGGAEGYGNTCSNGGGISSIGVSWTIINSLFSHNHAIGNGGNPAEDGTPGGGSGGAIYNDGGTMTLSLCGTTIEDNEVNAYGSGIIFVSNNHDGTLQITDSVIHNNTGGGWNVLPGISMHDDTVQLIDNSVIE